MQENRNNYERIEKSNAVSKLQKTAGKTAGKT